MAIQLMDGFDNYKDLTDLDKTYVLDNNDNNIDLITNGGRFGGGAVKTTRSNDSITFPCNIPVSGTIIFHASVFYAGDSDDNPIFRFVGSSGTFAEVEGVFSAAGTYVVVDENNDTVGSFNIPTSAWVWLEIKINFANAGSVEVRVNNVTVSTGSGDFDAGAGPITSVVWTTVGNGNAFIDDVVILDDTGTKLNDFLGDSRIQTFFPDGDGANTDWTTTGTSHYTEVNDDPHDGDTTYVESGTAGDRDTFNFPALNASPETIHAVQVSGIAKKTDANTQFLRGVAISNTTTGTSNGDATLSNEFSKPLGAIFLDDPNTGTEWTPTDLDNAEFGIEVV